MRGTWLVATSFLAYSMLARSAAAQTAEPSPQALSAYLIAGAGLIAAGALTATVGFVWLIASPTQSYSVVNVGGTKAPRLALPGGFALEPRGFTF